MKCFNIFYVNRNSRDIFMYTVLYSNCIPTVYDKWNEKIKLTRNSFACQKSIWAIFFTCYINHFLSRNYFQVVIRYFKSTSSNSSFTQFHLHFCAIFITILIKKKISTKSRFSSYWLKIWTRLKKNSTFNFRLKI